MGTSQFSLLKRRELVKLLRESGKGDYQYMLSFQNQDRPLEVYTVDIGFPCYRLGNGRTLAAQKEVISQKNLPSDFFTVDPDSEEALTEQHGILKNMVSQAGLLKIMKTQKQTQPLIVNNDGYLVNGNRRLCAMRILLEEDEQRYSHFKHVQVVILPPASDRDIKELEGRLQVLPEGRADYSWIDEAMLFRELREIEWTDEQIAQLYKKKVKDVRNQIAMLEDAEVYLAARKKSGRYSEVIKAEYAFIELQKLRPRCGEDEGKKQFFTEVTYLMLDEPKGAGDRLYDSIPEAFKNVDTIAAALKHEMKIAEPAVNGKDPFSALGGGQQNPFGQVTSALKDQKYAATAREIIKDTLEQARAEEREKKDSQYCMRQVQQAYSKLESALSAFDQNSDTSGITDMLKNIETVVDDIYERINNGNN